MVPKGEGLSKSVIKKELLANDPVIGKVPLVNNLKSTLVSVPTLLPALELDKAQASTHVELFSSPIRVQQTKRKSKTEPDSDVEFVSGPPDTKPSVAHPHEAVSPPQRKLRKKLRKSADTHQRHPSQRQSVILLSDSDGEQKLRPGHIVDAPKTPTRKPKFEDKIIDLCTPKQTQQLPNNNYINLCSPDNLAPATLQRSIQPAHGLVRLGSTFTSFEEAKAAVYEQQLRLGHRWRIAQGKTDNAGHRKKVILRCNHYYHHVPTHLATIDPSDHRKGKTIKTGCDAHVNLNRVPGTTDSWHVTTVNWDHNHDREIPEGGSAPKPPTAEQQTIIAELATSFQPFTRSQISAVLDTRLPNKQHALEPRQIGNVMNKARSEARKEVENLGGDVRAIIASLEQKRLEGHGWVYHIKLDETQTVTGVWWQSPLQAELGKRFNNVLINDNTYNRNSSGYPLNVGIIIDNFGASRNSWYALHKLEDTEHHNWVMRCHLDSAGWPPVTFVSDRSPSLIASCAATLPLTDHLYCINHLDGNIKTNLRQHLGNEYSNFMRDFWATYRAVSPEEFERLWNHLAARYPAAAHYLNTELYPCCERWAWCWVSFKFTAGTRTNGRVETENRVNKTIGGPKKTLKQLFDGLNNRTDGQTVQEMVRVREVSPMTHMLPHCMILNLLPS